ncbi:hypothetical protein Taro_009585, partial [Colocasia esculenta]|nr:hypothetical protein [Colocasia esculenta]
MRTIKYSRVSNITRQEYLHRTCAKAKETYGGLDKDSLVQSRVFPVERWSKSREVCRKRVRRASSARSRGKTIT